MSSRSFAWGVALWSMCTALGAQSGYLPTFDLSDYCGEWWQQVSVEPEAAWLEMEIVDGERWTLTRQSWGEFTSGEHVVEGTPVQLFATGPDGTEAASGVFAYLLEQPGVECEPDCLGDDCGSDGCGGSCGACALGFDCDAGQCVEEPPVSSSYDPDFEVVAGSANEWWQQIQPHAGARTVLLEVETGDEWFLAPQSWGHFTSGHHLLTGTHIRLTGTDDEGRMGRTRWFGYLEEQPVLDVGQCTPDCAGLECGADGCDGSCGTCEPDWSCEGGLCLEVPVCVADCTGAECGPDSCEGSCGTCDAGTTCVDGSCSSECVPPWDPSWSTEQAGEWWIEFRISGGADVVAASLEVEGRDDVDLYYVYGKWYGSPGSRLRSGTSVRLHAEHHLGQTAQTHDFAYLEEAPVTDPCGGTGPAGCTAFPAGLLTIGFDDAWASQYGLAGPALADRGLRANVFLLVTPMIEEWSGYLTVTQALDFVADGHEVGSHSMNHPYLTTVTDEELTWQMQASQQWLQSTFDQDVEHFAAPYTAINERVVAAAEQDYSSLCCLSGGLNTRGQDPYALRTEYVVSTTSVDDVIALIDETIDVGGWRVLGFHQFTTGTPSNAYSYRIADFEAILDYALASGIEVVTYSEAIARLPCE